jgi:DNA replicative helicase MCM subunit Mcm2 (Cdc46/Mcm family)
MFEVGILDGWLLVTTTSTTTTAAALFQDSLSEEEIHQLDRDIQKMVSSNDPIVILSQSIAPEVFGLADI